MTRTRDYHDSVIRGCDSGRGPGRPTAHLHLGGSEPAQNLVAELGLREATGEDDIERGGFFEGA